MVSVPCIVDNSNGFFLFILSLCRLVVFRDIIFVFFRKFWIVSVCFETVLFVSVVSIKVRNTETNRKKIFLVSRNKPKQTRNRSCFGLFRFEPKFIFVCFEDTLLWIHTSWHAGGGGGSLILDWCWAFDLFASVDAHLWKDRAMKETPRRRITVKSSLNEMSTDQLGVGIGQHAATYCNPFFKTTWMVFLTPRIFASWKGHYTELEFLNYLWGLGT